MDELAPCEGRDDGRLVFSLGCEVAHLRLESCASEVLLKLETRANFHLRTAHMMEMVIALDSSFK